MIGGGGMTLSQFFTFMVVPQAMLIAGVWFITRRWPSRNRDEQPKDKP